MSVLVIGATGFIGPRLIKRLVARGETVVGMDVNPGAARAAFGQMDPDTLCERGIIIAGDPESCIRGVRLYEEAGVDQVILIMQTETIPHERTLSSIEKFGKHVIPACRAESRKAVAAGV